jgi:hypothetical protein
MKMEGRNEPKETVVMQTAKAQNELSLKKSRDTLRRRAEDTCRPRGTGMRSLMKKTATRPKMM